MATIDTLADRFLDGFRAAQRAYQYLLGHIVWRLLRWLIVRLFQAAQIIGIFILFIGMPIVGWLGLAVFMWGSPVSQLKVLAAVIVVFVVSPIIYIAVSWNARPGNEDVSGAPVSRPSMASRLTGWWHRFTQSIQERRGMYAVVKAAFSAFRIDTPRVIYGVILILGYIISLFFYVEYYETTINSSNIFLRTAFEFFDFFSIATVNAIVDGAADLWSSIRDFSTRLFSGTLEAGGVETTPPPVNFGLGAPAGR